MFQEIKDSLRRLYLDDQRPWWVGFSGDVGPSSARPGPKALRPYNDATQSIPAEQRKKPISVLCTDTRVEIGHWGEAILHVGARRAESSTRAQTMAARQTRNGLRRHPDLPRVWVSNPIEFLSTEEVWADRTPTPEAIPPSTSFTLVVGPNSVRP